MFKEVIQGIGIGLVCIVVFVMIGSFIGQSMSHGPAVASHESEITTPSGGEAEGAPSAAKPTKPDTVNKTPEGTKQQPAADQPVAPPTGGAQGGSVLPSQNTPPSQGTPPLQDASP